MAEPIPAPTADEFKNWMPPKAAVDFLKANGRPDGTARKELQFSLRHAQVRAVAGTETSRGLATPLSVIAADSWQYVYAHDWPDFWLTGKVAFHLPRPRYDPRGSGEPTVEHACFDVRFDRAAVMQLVQRDDGGAAESLAFVTAQLAIVGEGLTKFAALRGAGEAVAQEPASSPMASTVTKTERVSAKNVRAWYRAQFADNPGLTFPEVYALASAHFKPLKVTRQPLRNVIGELGHGATRGNPAFRRK